MIVLLVHLRINKGSEKNFTNITKVAIEATKKEPGCVNYRLLQDPYDTTEFCLTEEWETLEDLQSHQRSTHLHTWREQSKSLIIEKTVKIYNANAINL